MLFQVLGPVEVSGADPASLRARKPRTLLTTLLLNANAWVSLDELVVAIWGDVPPASAERNVTTYVWQLRRALPAAADGERRVDGRTRAYRIRVEPGELDRAVFEDAAQLGRVALAADRPQDAVEHLRTAKGLWRGRPFAELDTDAARLEAGRLGEVFWTVRERLAEGLTAIGHAGEAVAMLTSLTTEDPLREGPWCGLVSSLHHAGRPAEALAAYQRARTTLVEELGVEPGPQLRALQQRVLTDDGAEVPAPPLARLLGVLPGLAADRFAAAALTATAPEEAADQLASLVRLGLAERAPDGPDGTPRYRLVAQPEQPTRDEPALVRLLDHYVHTGMDAAGLISATTLRDWTAGTPVPTLTDADAAHRWFGSEAANLVAAARSAADHEHVGHAWRLVRALQAHVDTTGPVPGWTRLLRAVLAAATGADPHGELVVRNALAITLWRDGERDASEGEFAAALTAAEAGTDERTLATTLINLAEVNELLGRHDTARGYLDRALQTLPRVDDPALSAAAHACDGRLAPANPGLYRGWTPAVPPAGRLGA